MRDIPSWYTISLLCIKRQKYIIVSQSLCTHRLALQQKELKSHKKRLILFIISHKSRVNYNKKKNSSGHCKHDMSTFFTSDNFISTLSSSLFHKRKFSTWERHAKFSNITFWSSIVEFFLKCKMCLLICHQ